MSSFTRNNIETPARSRLTLTISVQRPLQKLIISGVSSLFSASLCPYNTIILFLSYLLPPLSHNIYFPVSFNIHIHTSLTTVFSRTIVICVTLSFFLSLLRFYSCCLLRSFLPSWRWIRTRPCHHAAAARLGWGNGRRGASNVNWFRTGYRWPARNRLTFSR